MVLAHGQAGVHALFLAVKVFRLAHDHAKGIIAAKDFISRKNVVNKIVLADGRAGTLYFPTNNAKCT